MIYLISKFLVAIADIGLLYGVKMKMGIKYMVNYENISCNYFVLDKS